MPKKGFVAITIKESVHKALIKLAKKLDKSIPETVKFVAEHYQSKIGVEDDDH